jgi:hypothetical protein
MARLIEEHEAMELSYSAVRDYVRVRAQITGSLALAVSLPTMLLAFARFSRDKSFSVLWSP